ncbi:recombinase family protein [Bacillus paranthracis]
MENNGGIKSRVEQFDDVEQEQQVVKEIYRLFELGFGFQQIADEIRNKKWDERIKMDKRTDTVYYYKSILLWYDNNESLS